MLTHRLPASHTAFCCLRDGCAPRTRAVLYCPRARPARHALHATPTLRFGQPTGTATQPRIKRVPFRDATAFSFFPLFHPLPYASWHLRRTAIAARVPHPLAAQTLADAPDGYSPVHAHYGCDPSPGPTSPQSTRTYRIIVNCYYYTHHGSNSFLQLRIPFSFVPRDIFTPASASTLRRAGHCRRLFSSAQVFATRRELVAWPS